MPFALSSWPPPLDETNVCIAVLLHQAHGAADTVPAVDVRENIYYKKGQYAFIDSVDI